MLVMVLLKQQNASVQQVKGPLAAANTLLPCVMCLKISTDAHHRIMKFLALHCCSNGACLVGREDLIPKWYLTKFRTKRYGHEYTRHPADIVDPQAFFTTENNKD